jgi:hypothetical protein
MNLISLKSLDLNEYKTCQNYLCPNTKTSNSKNSGGWLNCLFLFLATPDFQNSSTGFIFKNSGQGNPVFPINKTFFGLNCF